MFSNTSGPRPMGARAGPGPGLGSEQVQVQRKHALEFSDACMSVLVSLITFSHHKGGGRDHTKISHAWRPQKGWWITGSCFRKTHL